MRSFTCVLLFSFFAYQNLPAQDLPTSGKTPPDDGVIPTLRERLQRLAQALDVLVRQGVRDPLLADVEIYRKALEWSLRHEEVRGRGDGDRLLSVADRGLLRASMLLRGESPWLFPAGQVVPRGYRSRIDGSVQPYAVFYPPDYGRDPRKKWRLDVVLHGRDAELNEVKFLHLHSGDALPKDPPKHLVLHAFGRGNLGYRWAAETDVLEAIEHFVSVERTLGRDWIDPRQVVLRGYSMGGAGTWHLGLHRPDRWAVLAPGAGFVTTRGYVNDLPASLPNYVEKCLSIYDADGYAANAWNVPIVAYAGEQDPQAQSVRRMQERIGSSRERLKVFLAPGVGHQFPPEWQSKVEAEVSNFLDADANRDDYPSRVVFHTFTLKYPGCHWVEILGLEQHYVRAEIDAQRQDGSFAVRTRNVRSLRLLLPPGEEGTQRVEIDGQSFAIRPSRSSLGGLAIYLEKKDGQWASTVPQRLSTQRLRVLQKFAGMTGPIDDAFTDSFLCVRGTGANWHPETQQFLERRLEQFRQVWSRYFRGELPVKNDDEVTEEDIATRHLILFGDPSSNHWLGHILADLPLTWTKEALVLAGQRLDASQHVPVLIFPSPLNPTRYVVINSGHTFAERDLAGSNALLFPRLGDFAVLRISEGDGMLVIGGLFDEFWRFPNQR
ncbi:MAG: S9 family peptidase [Gemmataceae bacterium]|nr:S9 family peptidase [Gemmataceae bacterium]